MMSTAPTLIGFVPRCKNNALHISKHLVKKISFVEAATSKGTVARIGTTMYQTDYPAFGNAVILQANPVKRKVCNSSYNVYRPVDDSPEAKFAQCMVPSGRKADNQTSPKTKILCEVYQRALKYDPTYPHPKENTKPVNIDDDISCDRPEPTEEINEHVYKIFETVMDDHVQWQPDPVYSGQTKKIGVAYGNTAFQVAVSRRAKVYPTVQTPVGVNMLPKISSVTSDGKIRRIFPMSGSLQRIQDHMFSGLKVKLPDAEIVYGPKFPSYKYTYDIKGMDKTIYPYILRYAKSKQVEDVLLPMVHSYVTGYLPQLPSGTTSTSVIGPIFTYAVARSVTDQHLYIQGDGFMTREPVVAHPYIRAEPDYTINGFSYHDGSPKYANALKKLNTPRLVEGEYNSRDVRVLQRKRDLRAAIYKVMLKSGDDLEPFRTEYFDYTPKQLAKEASKYGVCQRKLEYYGYNPKASCSMDVCPTVPIYQSRSVTVDLDDIKNKWLQRRPC